MELAEILRLDDGGDGDVWHAHTPPGTRRSDIYGGQVAGQSLLAAARTVEREYLPNSVHCYFLRRGNPELPLEISVERTRTGRTYASRQVDVRQAGKSIFVMLASFHTAEPSREFDHPMPDDVPDPETLPAHDDHPNWDQSLDLRAMDDREPVVRWWCRVTGRFPRDPVAQMCGLLYASDMRAGGAAMQAVGFPSFGRRPEDADAPGPPDAVVGNFGSLDHALWFHRVPVVDDWFFCQVQPLTVRDSRGLVLGTMFDRGGRHLASFTQEMFLKERPAGAG